MMQILHIASCYDDTDIDSSIVTPPSDDNIQSYLENYSSNDSNIVTLLRLVSGVARENEMVGLTINIH